MTANRYKGMLVMRTVMAALHSSGTTFTEKNPEVGDYKANPNSILDDNIKLVAYDDPLYEADSFRGNGAVPKRCKNESDRLVRSG